MNDAWASPRRARVRRATTTVTAVVTAAVLSLAAAGCTGGDAPVPTPSLPSVSEQETATTEPRPAPVVVRVTRVAGRMRASDRDVLADNVGKVVSAYFQDAYLGGDQPRTAFDDGFASFTRDAARSARRQEQLTTNAELGPTAEAVVARRQRAYLSVLAPTGEAVGATARVDLVYLVRRAERPDRVVTVRGRLLLTRDSSGGWQIFGYDLTRGDEAAGEQS